VSWRLAHEVRTGVEAVARLSAGELANPEAPPDESCARAVAELRGRLRSLAAAMRALARGEASEATSLVGGDLGAA